MVMTTGRRTRHRVNLPPTPRSRIPAARLPYATAAAGVCRLCGKPSPGATWHDTCHQEWRLTDPRVLRAAVAARDGGRCLDCADDVPPWPDDQWQADHIVELVDGGRNTLENVVTRCVWHHAYKSAVARRLRRCGGTYGGRPRQTALFTA